MSIKVKKKYGLSMRSQLQITFREKYPRDLEKHPWSFLKISGHKDLEINGHEDLKNSMET
jgi:hypothetical protein